MRLFGRFWSQNGRFALPAAVHTEKRNLVRELRTLMLKQRSDLVSVLQ